MNIETIKADYDMLTVGTIPLNPDIRDYDDANGKLIMFVRDEVEGRSLYMGLELYGEVSRLWEVRYDDFAQVVGSITMDIALRDIEEGK